MNDTPLPLTVWAISATGLPEPFGHVLHGFRQRADVVAVDLVRIPAERRPFVAQRRQHQRLVGARGRLPLVVVDDDADVFELLRGGEHRGLPDRALVVLAVGQQREDAEALALDPARQRHAAAERQAVAERAGGGLDAGQQVRRRMLGEPAAVLAIGVELFDREIALHRQRGVQRRGGVALGQDEAVAQRILRLCRIDVEHMPIGRGQRRRRRTARRPDAPPAPHATSR